MNVQTLADKLKLLTLFRLLVAFVFLIATLVGMHNDAHFLSTAGRELVYAAVTGLLLLCVLAAFLLERWRDQRRLLLLTYAHFVGDALFATVLVILTGGVESVFTFLYSLAIINASIVLYRHGALFSACVNAIFLVVVAFGQTNMLGDGFRSLVADGTIFWRSHGFAGDLPGILPSLTLNVLAFFGIAFLSSYLAEQMRSADIEVRTHKEGLEELTRLHENIVSSLETGLLTVNAERQVTFANGTAAALLGHPKEALVNLSVDELVPDLGRVLANPDKARHSHTETLMLLVRGRRTWLRWTVSPLRTREARQVGHLLLFADVTRLKEMEEVVQRSERLAALGRMAANIAHEIRNPLASMSGSIQLLADSLDVDGAEKKLMNIVVREAEHLNQWITEFLEYARPREIHTETLELSELVREVMEMLRYDERCRDRELTWELAGDSDVAGDRGHLRQVVWNLTLNALEAVEAGGHVRVSVATDAGSVRFEVADDGPGIPPDQASRIFEPFFTTKARGTGLGLATVHRNVEDHHGTIQVVSAPDSPGTVFTVTLPRPQRQPEPTPQPERTPQEVTDGTDPGR